MINALSTKTNTSKEERGSYLNLNELRQKAVQRRDIADIKQNRDALKSWETFIASEVVFAAAKHSEIASNVIDATNLFQTSSPQRSVRKRASV